MAVLHCKNARNDWHSTTIRHGRKEWRVDLWGTFAVAIVQFTLCMPYTARKKGQAQKIRLKYFKTSTTDWFAQLYYFSQNFDPHSKVKGNFIQTLYFSLLLSITSLQTNDEVRHSAAHYLWVTKTRTHYVNTCYHVHDFHFMAKLFTK